MKTPRSRSDSYTSISGIWKKFAPTLRQMEMGRDQFRPKKSLDDLSCSSEWTKEGGAKVSMGAGHWRCEGWQHLPQNITQAAGVHPMGQRAKPCGVQRFSLSRTTGLCDYTWGWPQDTGRKTPPHRSGAIEDFRVCKGDAILKTHSKGTYLSRIFTTATEARFRKWMECAGGKTSGKLDGITPKKEQGEKYEEKGCSEKYAGWNEWGRHQLFKLAALKHTLEELISHTNRMESNSTVDEFKQNTGNAEENTCKIELAFNDNNLFCKSQDILLKVTRVKLLQFFLFSGGIKVKQKRGFSITFQNKRLNKFWKHFKIIRFCVTIGLK